MKHGIVITLALLLTAGLWGQSSPPANDSTQLRQEVEALRKQNEELQKRLDNIEKTLQTQTESSSKSAQTTPTTDTTSVTDLQTNVKDLNERMNSAERKTVQDRLRWSGDYRFQGHSIIANVPAHYDGMMLQNLMVKTLWLAAPATQGGMGMPLNPAALPPDPNMFVNGMLNPTLAANYGKYQYFANNLTFTDLKSQIGSFPPAMQQQLQQYLMGVNGVYQNAYNADNGIMYTNRLRLRFQGDISDNMLFEARLSMYKSWGDSTGVQMFNGQPNSIALDGTTTNIPNGDMIRVERAFFNWNNIGGSKFYLSIGRRPSTEGPPMNLRFDEPRGGTPSGSLIDYQFDGLTFGYHYSDKMIWRLCYGVGYQSGFGNANILKLPQDRLKDVHFLGGNFDVWSTDKSFVQVTIARAFNVTDGFNGQIVLPNNPVTGDPIGAPLIMRFTPSANLGAINLYGLNAQRTFGHIEAYGSANWSSLRPNGLTTPFGGLVSDPFETPADHDGQMYLVGLRYGFPKNDDKTKIGFEFNHGSRYWFNFAQAEDDILMPKSNTRGEVYEAYITHRVNDRFTFRGAYQRYNYAWSGSGWHLGAPKRLDSVPLLGFPTYDEANVFTFGVITRF